MRQTRDGVEGQMTRGDHSLTGGDRSSGAVEIGDALDAQEPAGYQNMSTRDRLAQGL